MTVESVFWYIHDKVEPNLYIKIKNERNDKTYTLVRTNEERI